MKIKVGVMGPSAEPDSPRLGDLARSLGEAIAARDLILFTGATTGTVYLIGKTAGAAGALHIGISPAANETEHVERFKLPLDACAALIYTGFGLKGRNVVLVRSCDIVIIFAGSMGGLNEFTISYDEGKVIGCLKGSGGAADEIERLVKLFKKQTKSRIVYDDDPERLIERCVQLHEAGQ